MKTKIAGFVMGLCLSAAVAQAEEWSTNLACFKGGSYDGWDRCVMTNNVGLGGALVTLSSGSNQLFDWTQAGPALAMLTIAAEDPAGTITNGVTMHVSVPAAWRCRFDTNVTLTYGGGAQTKVGAASFSGDGRTLLIPVTTTFVAADTLTVSGLKLADLRLVPADTKYLELDFDGDGNRDVYDLYTVQVRVKWDGGSYDGWDRCVMTNNVGLGGALVTLSSGSNQLFDWTQAGPALAMLTITATDPAGTITNGVTIQVSVPAAWGCRFDAGSVVTYSGNAAGKVSAANFSGNGRSLQIPVTGTFVAADTLTVSGLKLADLQLAPANPAPFGLDFTGDGAPDAYDLYTVQVRATWSGGSYDGWDRYAVADYASLASFGGTVFKMR